MMCPNIHCYILCFKLIANILKGFYLMWGGGHLGHMNQIPEQAFVLPTHGCFTCNLALIGQAVMEKTLFENNGHIHVYIPGEGTDNPLGSEVLYKHKYCVTLSFAVSFFHYMYTTFYQYFFK